MTREAEPDKILIFININFKCVKNMMLFLFKVFGHSRMSMDNLYLSKLFEAKKKEFLNQLTYSALISMKAIKKFLKFCKDNQDSNVLHIVTAPLFTHSAMMHFNYLTAAILD